jgi:Protein of unknown function (DUF1549)/Protein of unknown function (DUF1553)
VKILPDIRLPLGLLAVLAAGFSPAVAEELLPADRPIAEVIDQYVGLKLKKAAVAPAPQTDDATLVRRLTLDLAGRIPTRAEVQAYLDSKVPDKRARLIERLMASPEYVRHSATEFDALLRSGNDQAPSVRNYLITALKENRPWDRMFRELLGVQPDPLRPDHFVLKRLGDVDVLTRDVSSVFFGLNVMCAQCHKHPYISSITQDYYHGMKSFFARSIDFQGDLWEKQYALMQYKAKGGQVRTPKLMFLSGTVIDEPETRAPDLAKAVQEETKQIEELRKNFAKNKAYPAKPAFSYREQLVRVALLPTERDQLARSLVNRLWYRFHGHGLVMRLDQMHAGNPPSHPELLQWLARDFIAHNYDLRRLVQGMVSSQTYSRGSRWDGGNPPALDLFAVANLRPLSPMQFGVSQLLIDPDGQLVDDLSGGAAKWEKLEAEAQKLFGSLIEQPQDGLQINVAEALKLSNDEALLRLLGNRLVSQLLKTKDRRQQIELAVWTILSRPPTEEEVKVLSSYLARREGNEEDRARLAREAQQQREDVERARAHAVALETEIAQLTGRHRDAGIRASLAQTERFITAAAEWQLEARDNKNTLEAVAVRHSLDVGLLRRWDAYLSRPVGVGTTPAPDAAAVKKGLYTTKLTQVRGQKSVNGWGSDATPWLMANSSEQPIRLGTLTLPPRSVSTHPAPTRAAAVGWIAPAAGVVRVAGKLTDIDPNCGNGIAWSVEVLRDGGKQVLASGTIDNGKAATITADTVPALAEIKVQPGDLISLIVDAREQNHACDSTHVEFVVGELGGKARKWDLAADVVDTIHAGNPHADGQGNAAVWHFYAVSPPGSLPQARPSIPAGSALSRWSEQLGRLRQARQPDPAAREELARLIRETHKLLTTSAAPAKGDPNAILLRELVSPEGPLFGGIDFSAALDAGAKAKLNTLNAELVQARRSAARPILMVATAETQLQKGLQQMVWALLAGAEFRFNH